MKQITDRNFELLLDGIRVLREAEMIVMPMTPSALMVDIGARAGGVGHERAKVIFDAMVSAYFMEMGNDGDQGV